MSRLLHVEASPNGDRSVSAAMAAAFLDAYAAMHPEDETLTLNVWSEDLPTFGSEHAAAKFAPLLSEVRTPAQERPWREITDTLRDFDSADKLVISCPMWNYSIPHALKNYIDLIVQPGLSFSARIEEGDVVHFGLLRVNGKVTGPFVVNEIRDRLWNSEERLLLHFGIRKFIDSAHCLTSSVLFLLFKLLKQCDLTIKLFPIIFPVSALRVEQLCVIHEAISGIELE